MKKHDASALSLYSIDLGWRGGIAVLAANPEDAAEVLLSEHKDHLDYLKGGCPNKKTLVARLRDSTTALTPGTLVSFQGDL